MIIEDRIYGAVHVDDPLIQALIASAPMQRLRAISQDGATHFVWPVFDGNRFEHSFGAWYLAKRFNRPIEEQAACLLHDVPHTAFSHVVDFVMNDHNQEYHDRFLQKIVLDSEIPELCSQHGFDIHKILQKESYYLLDNKTPELSFDRWDYFMRDAHMLGILSRSDIRRIIESAKIQGGQFYFDNLEVASQLCLTSIMVCRLMYISATPNGAWFLLAKAIKTALHERILTELDLFGTDNDVWTKLEESDNTTIQDCMARLRPGSEFVYAQEGEAEFCGRNKARYIDPLVLCDDKVLRAVSQLVPGLPTYIDEFKEQCQFIGVKPKK